MVRPTPVIIDTDPGVDDALALLLAAASPELEVLAVTTVGGNVSLDQATENARRIVPLAWGSRPHPPIHRGEACCLETAEYVHGQDGLGGVTFSGASRRERYPAAAPVADTPAFEVISSLVRAHPVPVTLVTLGPLTNAAAAFRRDPEGMRRVREVVIMGGTFRETGNTTPVAEFNVFADPESAQALCGSGLPLRWVPLDVTQQCLLRPAHLEALPDSSRAAFIREIARFYMDYHHRGHGEHACYLHDPTAVAAVIWPELFRTVPMRVDVETTGTLTRGMTIADFRHTANRSTTPPNSRIALEVDHEELLRRIVPRLA